MNRSTGYESRVTHQPEPPSTITRSTRSWTRFDEDRYTLNADSAGAARVLHTRTGVDYRIKVTFEGDERNRAVDIPFRSW